MSLYKIMSVFETPLKSIADGPSLIDIELEASVRTSLPRIMQAVLRAVKLINALSLGESVGSGERPHCSTLIV